jgi:hypothetical protein
MQVSLTSTKGLAMPARKVIAGVLLAAFVAAGTVATRADDVEVRLPHWLVSVFERIKNAFNVRFRAATMVANAPDDEIKDMSPMG